jgi:2-phosphosulfolactate phosphatase
MDLPKETAVEIRHATLAECAEATGALVAIDVLRAFTTAAYAFAAGAERIVLAGEIDEAFRLRAALPDALIMGEKNGLRVPGFDFGNSPSELRGLDLSGHTLIQRTSAGTQGLVRARKAGPLLAAGLCNARATVEYLNTHVQGAVTLVATGVLPGEDGDEDIACAELLAATLRGRTLELPPLIERVRLSTWGLNFTDTAHPEFPLADLELALQVDRFTFAMPVHREGDQLVMRAERI